MGIFSSDEDPSWTDVINYQGKIEELEQENRKLKEELAATKCYNCGETFLTPEGAELYEENVRYKKALKEIEDIVCDIIEDNGEQNLDNESSPIRIREICREVLK